MTVFVIILSMLSPSFSSPEITNSSSSPTTTFSARLNIHSTTFSTPEGLYIFQNVDGIYVNGDKVDISEWVFQYAEGGRGGLIIDTGTTMTRLYSLALDALVTSLRDHISFEPIEDPDDYNDPWPLCYRIVDVKRIELLPEVDLRFTDNTTDSLLFKNENIWIASYDEAWCLAFIKTKDTSILGIYQQRDMRFGFDLRRQLVSMEYDFC